MQYPQVSPAEEISALIDNQHQHVHQQQVMLPPNAQVVPTPRKSTSFFQKFFVIQEGVISLSLRDMTLIATLSITADLLINLYSACNTKQVECDFANGKIPMISGVICLPFWDRIFCLLTAFFAWTCHQVNIRANYKKMYGIATDCTNDTCMYLGIASVVSLPLIGFFDEHNFGICHGILAVTFFGCTGIYATMMARSMSKNKDKLPLADQNVVKTINVVSKLMMTCLATLAVSIALFGSNYWLTPAAEWATGILFLNFFSFLVYANPYYDSIHPYGQLVAPGTVVLDAASQNTF